MKVENYEHCAFKGLKRRDVSLPEKVVERVIREAQEVFEDFEIDFQAFTPKLVMMHGIVGQVEWTNAKGVGFTMSEIYFDRRTGEILQSGAVSFDWRPRRV